MQDQVQRHKLLLADDSVTIQKVVNLTFADEGIDVISVGDGNSALDMLRDDSPDIVLADVNIPGLTGYEICAKIKERSPEDRIPVVLLVGSFEPFDEEEAERVGADGYLTKPFQSISQLVEKVAELLGSRGEADEVSDSQLHETDSEPANGAIDEPGPVEFGATSFPNPFEKFLRPEASDAASEPRVFEREFTNAESGPVDFEDIDDFEMAEAFAKEEVSSGFSEFADEEVQIESVSDDFLKTQPMTDSDFHEISVESESKETDELQEEFNEWTSAESDFSRPEGTDETSRFSVAENGSEFGEMKHWTEGEGGFDQAQEQGSETTTHDADPDEGHFEKSFNFRSAESFADDPGPSGPDEPASGPGSMDDEPPLGNESSFDEIPKLDSNAETLSAVQDVPLPEIASILDLDEINLLELPPLDDKPEVPEEIISSAHTPPVVVDGGEPDVEEFLSANEPGPQRTNGQNVVQSVSETVSADQGLSREMVEAITQRVIEVLSEKAIREIAWEVVPDMAELIIKKMAEERLRN